MRTGRHRGELNGCPTNVYGRGAYFDRHGVPALLPIHAKTAHGRDRALGPQDVRSLFSSSANFSESANTSATLHTRRECAKRVCSAAGHTK